MTDPVYIGQARIHPAAQLFPEMSSEELSKLADDIKRRGIRQPLVMYDGMVLDGRNRIRAALIAGIPFEKMPRANVPPDADPYALAWSLNCERLAYNPAQKAEIHKRIADESGRLAKMRSEAEESRREKAAESNKRRAAPRASGFRHVAEAEKPTPAKPASPPVAAEPKPDSRKNSVAAKMAKEAGVSQRTMERVLSRTQRGSNGPRQSKGQYGETWRLPRDPKLMAVFLKQWMPSDKIAELVAALTSQPVVDAA
jgi:hypothetical protein